ncbi:MAG: hypothetical protein AAGJ93_09880, partial [Bacteroidota bacterium]
MALRIIKKLNSTTMVSQKSPASLPFDYPQDMPLGVHWSAFEKLVDLISLTRLSLRESSFFVFLSLLFGLFANAQTSISGTPNVYANLVGQTECENSISVTNADVFVPGMGILILQSTGASIDLGNSATYGTINDMNGCGQYEYNRIVAINGTTLSLEFEIRHNYDVFHTQVVGFQIYEDASVDGLLSAPPLSSTGGIIVIEVEN